MMFLSFIFIAIFLLLIPGTLFLALLVLIVGSARKVKTWNDGAIGFIKALWFSYIDIAVAWGLFGCVFFLISEPEPTSYAISVGWSNWFHQNVQLYCIVLYSVLAILIPRRKDKIGIPILCGWYLALWGILLLWISSFSIHDSIMTGNGYEQRGAVTLSPDQKYEIAIYQKGKAKQDVLRTPGNTKGLSLSTCSYKFIRWETPQTLVLKDEKLVNRLGHECKIPVKYIKQECDKQFTYD